MDVLESPTTTALPRAASAGAGPGGIAAGGAAPTESFAQALAGVIAAAPAGPPFAAGAGVPRPAPVEPAAIVPAVTAPAGMAAAPAVAVQAPAVAVQAPTAPIAALPAATAPAIELKGDAEAPEMSSGQPEPEEAPPPGQIDPATALTGPEAARSDDPSAPALLETVPDAGRGREETRAPPLPAALPGDAAPAPASPPDAFVPPPAPPPPVMTAQGLPTPARFPGEPPIEKTAARPGDATPTLAPMPPGGGSPAVPVPDRPDSRPLAAPAPRVGEAPGIDPSPALMPPPAPPPSVPMMAGPPRETSGEVSRPTGEGGPAAVPERAPNAATVLPVPLPVAPSPLPVQPAEAAAPPRLVPRTAPVEQVAPVAVALALGGPEGRLAISLDPVELGRVEVTVERVGEAARVQVAAERPETLALLARDGAALDRALGGAGIGAEGGRSLSFTLLGDAGGGTGPGTGGGSQGGESHGGGSQGGGRRPGTGRAGRDFQAEEAGPQRRALLGLLDIAI